MNRRYRYLLLAAGLLALGAFARAEEAPAAPEGPALAQADLKPGQETKVVDPSLGSVGYYQVYLPPEYVPDRAWPTIFCYHGMGGSPTTWPFRQVLGGKGFVVIGMCYAGGKGGEAYRATDADTENVRRLVPQLVKRLNMDRRQLFVGGFSMGGWMTSIVGEAAPSLWVGMAIMGAGRQGSGRDPDAWRGKPIYVGAGENDGNHVAAERAAEFYRAKGARVTFETYKGKGHEVDADSKTLRDWLWDNGPLGQVKVDLAAAKKAQAAGKSGQAYALYQQVAAIPGDHEPCLQARSAAEALAKQADDALTAAQAALDAKRYAEATAGYLRLAASYQGSEFGDRAAKALAGLKADPAAQSTLDHERVNAQAKVLEDQARAHEQAKDYAKAIEAYEKCVAEFPAADRSAEVRRRLGALKADPAVQAAIRSQDAERDCRGWLSMADNFARAGRTDTAREYLKKILDTYPGTDWAKQAAERMKKLK